MKIPEIAEAKMVKLLFHFCFTVTLTKARSTPCLFLATIKYVPSSDCDTSLNENLT